VFGKGRKGRPVSSGRARSRLRVDAACQQSGYGVFTADNKYLTFDDSGNTKAIAALKKSKKKDDLKVTVTGDVQGDTIKVSSLKLM
jgi:hypothetical protein